MASIGSILSPFFMAMKIISSILLCFVSLIAVGQQYTPSSVFAHNDYAQADPFYGAYENRVGYIEADIFFRNNELFVAHLQTEINAERTLASLYLIPLQETIIKNKGWAYPDSTITLTLMIDLKTEGVATVKKLVDQLNQHKELLMCKTLEIMISGNVPDPKLWKDIPTFIFMDGRPNIPYTADQLDRVRLISTNFNQHVSWSGKDKLKEEYLTKLELLIRSVHSKGKKIRFWAAPDFENGWKTLQGLGVDVIGTDNVEGLMAFVKK